MKKYKGINPADFRALYNYDPDTGVVTRALPLGKHKAGTVAGTINNRGYHIVDRSGVFYSVSVMIWRMLYGDIPTGYVVDHINRDTTDNRLSNLRLITQAANNHNTPSRSATGAKGVYKNKDGFKATIKVDHRMTYLGTFPTVEEASNAYNSKAKEVYGFEYTR